LIYKPENTSGIGEGSAFPEARLRQLHRRVLALGQRGGRFDCKGVMSQEKVEIFSPTEKLMIQIEAIRDLSASRN
jgi:hypothetical protein